MRSDEPLDLVTVVFAGEVDFLWLQAASIARFVPPDLVRRIFVVLNDADEEGCRDRVEALIPFYGVLAPKVEIVQPDLLFALRPRSGARRSVGIALRHCFTRRRSIYPYGRKGGWRCNRGWAMQQALKLAIARMAQAPFVLILDAKNHFVREVSQASFIGPGGRARSRSAVPSAKQHGWIVASFRRLGLTPPEPSAPAPPILTPFCVPRSVLRDCLEDLEAAAGPVETFFARKRTLEAEFMLIYASVVRRHGAWGSVFEPGLLPPAIVGRSGPMEAAFAAVEAEEAEVMAVHRARLHRLTPAERARLEAIWRERDLPSLWNTDAAAPRSDCWRTR